MPTSRLRKICVTINRWKEEDYQNLLTLKFNYIIIGREGKGEGKTPHLQCYIQLTNAMTLTALKKKIKGGHVEEAKKSAEYNIEYCKKEGDYDEFGTPERQGKRVDLDHIRQMALNEGMRAVTRVGDFSQIKIAEKFLSYNEPPRNWKPTVFWIYGDTGSGKSRLARSILYGTTSTDIHDDLFVLHPILSTDNPDPYTKSDPSKWWNGYDAHPNVIIDDFRPNWWPFVVLLGYLDRYECQVEIKGEVRQFKPKNIVVTSIDSPEETYCKGSEYLLDYKPGKPKGSKSIVEPVDQLFRRIDVLIELDYFYEENGKRNIDKANCTARKMVDGDYKIKREVTKCVIDFNESDEIHKKLFN